jgi:DNA-binding transcriptional regulator LsrR (DeoR family)
VNDIASELGISTKIIRGALGSLVKKGIVTIDTNDSGYDIIYLNTKYWSLVNENWAEEAKEYL